MPKRVSKAKWASMTPTQRKKLQASLSGMTVSRRPATTRRVAARKAPVRRSPVKSGLGSMIRKGARALAPYIPGGSLISSIMGRGDYKVKQNSILGVGGPPKFRGSKGTIIRHREYIRDIYSSTGFNVEYFNVNPGMSNTFPWLGPIACNYEQWIPHGMLFEFVSTSADALNSTNTALGKVMLCTDYNPTENSFASSQEMQNYENCVVGPPSQSLIHGIECAHNQNVLHEQFVRNGALASNQNVMFYDQGIFGIATTGMQAADINVGELWVTYEIELLKPKIFSGVGRDVLSCCYTHTGTTSAYFSGATLVQDSIGISLGSATITFPDSISSGEYLLYYDVSGDSTACTALSVAMSTNCTVSTNSTFTGPRFTGSVTTTLVTYMVAFVVTGPEAKLTLSGGTFPANATSGRIILSQVDRDAGVMSKMMNELKGRESKREVKEKVKEKEPQVTLDSDGDTPDDYEEYKSAVRAAQSALPQSTPAPMPVEEKKASVRSHSSTPRLKI